MGFIVRSFPNTWSRLRIFICYAREDRNIAIDIQQSLINAGHDVFIDANSLRVATDFNEEIRSAISRADRFIFLASKHSLPKESYPQTELGFAQKRWPSPKRRVWPVIVDPTVQPEELPSYLRSIQVYTPKGNLVADLTAEIDASRAVRPFYLFASLALLGVLGAAAAGLAKPSSVSYVLSVPEQVDFRPQTKPGPDDTWQDSTVALALIPVSYINDSSIPIRIVDEIVKLPIGDRIVEFKWYSEVDMGINCEDWLCTKASIGASTLEGNRTLRRETMFVQADERGLTWKEFVKYICDANISRIDITLLSKGRSSSMFGIKEHIKSTICQIDLKKEREALGRRGCAAGAVQLPIRISPVCLAR